MGFRFDARAALAEIQKSGAPLPTPPIVPTPDPPEAKPVGTIGTVEGAAPRNCISPDLDRFEEVAAILEYDEGLPRPEAERLAAERVAQGAAATEAADEPAVDRAYLAHLAQHGPATMGAAAVALGWGATRAWQAEARLRAAGLVTLGPLGKAYPVPRGSEGFA